MSKDYSQKLPGTILDPFANVGATEIELVAKAGAAKAGAAEAGARARARARAVHMHGPGKHCIRTQMESQTVFESELAGCHGPSFDAH